MHFQKTLVLSIICSNCDSKDEKIFQEGKSMEILKILDLIINKKKSTKTNITEEK